QQIVSQYTGATGAKQQLAEMMLFENDIQGAKPYIEQLLREAPDMPAVKRMSIALMVDQKAPQEEILKQYNQFPEKTRGERLYKAMVARVIQNIDDSKRLLELILKDDPGDAEAAVSLARLLENFKSDKPGAAAVIEAALKAKPNEANL